MTNQQIYKDIAKTWVYNGKSLSDFVTELEEIKTEIFKLEEENCFNINNIKTVNKKFIVMEGKEYPILLEFNIHDNDTHYILKPHEDIILLVNTVLMGRDNYKIYNNQEAIKYLNELLVAYRYYAVGKQIVIAIDLLRIY